MQFTIGARIKAARHLAGFTRVEQLAEELRAAGVVRGLGTTKLRRYERDELPQDVRDLQAIADVCGLPLAFFVADFSRLPEIVHDPRRTIAQETAAAAQRFQERRAGKPANPRPRRAADH